MSKLTAKQKLFCNAYLETLNATEAARRAGYSGDYNTLSTRGSINLRNEKIQAYIEYRLNKLAMSAGEILVRLSRQAVGIDLTQYIKIEKIYEVVDGTPCLVGQEFTVDVDKLNDHGVGDLIKKLQQNTKGSLIIEVYDPQKALELLGKYYKLWTGKIEHGLSDAIQDHLEGFNRLIEGAYGDPSQDEKDNKK